MSNIRSSPTRWPSAIFGVVFVWFLAVGETTAQTPAAFPRAGAVVVTVPGDTLALPGPACGFEGPSDLQLSPAGDSLISSSGTFPREWFGLALPGPSGACDAPRKLRVFPAESWPDAPLPERVVVYAESRVAEVAGSDLTGWTLLAVRNGRVRGAAECLGSSTCAVALGSATLRALVREEGQGALVLWPSSVPLEDGAELPVAPDGRGGWLSWRGQALPPARVEFRRPLIEAASVNIASERAWIPLAVPEAVAAVNCRRARCALSGRGIELFAVDPRALSVDVHLTLAERCVRVEDGRETATASQSLALVRCAMQAAADVPLLAGAENHRYFVAVARDCFAADLADLTVETRPPTNAYVKAETTALDSGWRVFELVFERVPESERELSVVLSRRGAATTRLGTVSIPISGGFLPMRLSFELSDLGVIDFIPANQDARVLVAWDDEHWEEDLRVESRRGLYRARRKGRGDLRVRAVEGARGSVALRLAYVPQALTRFLGREERLVRVDTEARFPLRAVNLPLPLVGNGDGQSVVRLFCTHEGEDLEIPPGRTTSISYDERDSCRLVIDRQAIPAEAGEQRLRIAAGAFKEIISVAHHTGAITVSLPAGERKEFDTLAVTVGHEYSGGHYDLSPRHNIGSEATFRVVLGDRIFRISASTALPTGLFRFWGGGDHGSVPLSVGVTSRFAFLYREGTEFPLGIELGVLGTGLSDSPNLSIVAGVGFSIPVLNQDSYLQTSFNIHAWFEYSPTREGPDSDKFGFLFGPSFTVGKFSTTL